MREFMDRDFLLSTPTARKLFHDYAENMPIIDYHCHINPAEIAGDRKYETITQVWLGGDHYKWRAMRCNGVPEALITGKESSDFEKFRAWAKTLPQCIGNPLYHWTYLELKAYFGITEELNENSAKKIYELCNEKLAEDGMSVRGIIRRSNVTTICTTDDPADDLVNQKLIQQDDDIDFNVFPAFRPDKAFNIDKPGFAEYIKKLSAAANANINSFKALMDALESRVEYFNSLGCKASDHALDYCVCNRNYTDGELDGILENALKGNAPTEAEADKFKTAVLVGLSKLYSKLGWVMQIHFGCIRNLSAKMFEKLGPDTGYDAMGNSKNASELAGLLNAMEENGHLPKMVLYSLNQYDNEIIATIAGAFQTDADCRARIQLGAAWWFNDTKTGMQKQLTDLGNLGVLGSFIGMLTDSRSFLSYTRHEYFRRILCNWIGTLVENGEYFNNIDVLGEMVKNISYNNTRDFFGFNK